MLHFVHLIEQPISRQREYGLEGHRDPITNKQMNELID